MAKGLKALYTFDELQGVAQRATEAEGTKSAAGDRMRNAASDPTQLNAAIRKAYADAYQAGQKTASDQTGRPIDSGTAIGASSSAIDWANWNPGNPEAALKAADGGLADLLNNAGIVVRGIQDTTIDRLGNILAQGLLDGTGAYDIARAMNDYLDDPARAEMIALTECNRAMTEAQLDEYQVQGFSAWEWIAYDGACDECAENDGQEFQPGDDAPPAHPNCRCGTAPSGPIA